MMKNNFRLGLLFLLIFAGCTNKTEQNSQDISTYISPEGTSIHRPDSASIAQNYQIPDWFKDAKLGIFIHWGVYSVPAFGNEWYPRNMYKKGSTVYEHHLNTIRCKIYCPGG